MSKRPHSDISNITPTPPPSPERRKKRARIDPPKPNGKTKLPNADEIHTALLTVSFTYISIGELLSFDNDDFSFEGNYHFTT